MEGVAVNPLDLFTERRPTVDPTLETEATSDKRHHETLYGEMARRTLNWQRVVFVLLAICLWDRVELWHFAREKQYVPTPMGTLPDGRKYFLGMPDPTWKPDDAAIVGELRELVDTIRGRTLDAQFDRKRWENVVAHCTDVGKESVRQALDDMDKVQEKGRIVVTFNSITKYTDETFDLRWQEERQNEAGKVQHTFRFQGLFHVVIDVPRTRSGLEQNIAGVWHNGWHISDDKV